MELFQRWKVFLQDTCKITIFSKICPESCKITIWSRLVNVWKFFAQIFLFLYRNGYKMESWISLVETKFNVKLWPQNISTSMRWWWVGSCHLLFSTAIISYESWWSQREIKFMLVTTMENHNKLFSWKHNFSIFWYHSSRYLLLKFRYRKN